MELIKHFTEEFSVKGNDIVGSVMGQDYKIQADNLSKKLNGKKVTVKIVTQTGEYSGPSSFMASIWKVFTSDYYEIDVRRVFRRCNVLKDSWDEIFIIPKVTQTQRLSSFEFWKVAVDETLERRGHLPLQNLSHIFSDDDMKYFCILYNAGSLFGLKVIDAIEAEPDPEDFEPLVPKQVYRGLKLKSGAITLINPEDNLRYKVMVKNSSKSLSKQKNNREIEVTVTHAFDLSTKKHLWRVVTSQGKPLQVFQVSVFNFGKGTPLDIATGVHQDVILTRKYNLWETLVDVKLMAHECPRLREFDIDKEELLVASLIFTDEEFAERVLERKHFLPLLEKPEPA